MARPATTPTWATTGTRTAPTAGKILTGFAKDDPVPFGLANWLWGYMGDWFTYWAGKITANRYTYDTTQDLILNTSALAYTVNDSGAGLAVSFGTPPNIGYTATGGTAHLWHEINPVQFYTGGGNYTFSSFYGTTRSTDVGVTSVSYTFFKYKADGSTAATSIATVTNDGTSGTGWIQDSPTSLGEAFDPAYIYGIRVIIVGNAGGNALFQGVVLKMTATGAV